ncbi:type II secretory pathway protein LspJ [Legionella nautarum]|uniref:Type II secretion system protein J n=1 Tax=Legionella nautarum TaxID=45070 RepID=A0A0W0WV83_9GAMM|nr:GspJ family T2SS minor pseudopilin variant LspJ [Legionella nautarum]KTD36232.1 type II secretory pathway protein LspJ [Legionella nautarum]
MKTEKGFTLIEILIALTVFAILAAITSSAMYYAFNTRSRVSEQAERLNALQLAITLIEHDTEQVIVRDIRAGHEMQLHPVFEGEAQYLEFTRSGFVNPNSEEKRSVLQRVAFLCQNNQLIRRSWVTLDPVNREIYQDKILIDRLMNCQFAYLNHNLQVLSEWRPNAVQQNQRAEPIPKAIQMNLRLNDWGKMSLLFIIPGALYAEK